ncbi:ATP-binding protein [Butyrivibrio sp. FCS014]|uniref:ATP-binding protein n=1 Tax=Butyrivibrio sp. FCS014 TaxID=1408304 RepID=UPI0004639A68|nr:ATP-binding protein [Butyrivibrio sp. FCS014]
MEEQRKIDLAFLNRFYESGRSNILVVYGHRNIEQNSLIFKFIENRRSVFYTARSCSATEQVLLWAGELMEEGSVLAKTPTFTDIFETAFAATGRNPVIFVIKNFEYIVKSSDTFMKELTDFVEKNGKYRQILVLLMSNDVSWVENSMVSSLGALSAHIAGFRKIKPLSFAEMRAYFKNMPYRDAVLTYSVLGGQTLLWRYFDDSLSFRENVIKNILDPGSFLYGEAMRLTEYSLRETAVYHTLLSEMARGANKLNDIYHVTGFSRAKISVYLKTLIHHDFAEKAYSFGNAGRENVMKGVYRICDPLLDFYFRFIFPNESSLLQMPADKFYDIFISAGIQNYAGTYFRQVCREYILRLEERGLFPFEIEEEGEWIGKEGTIDIIAQSEMGDTALGICSWQKTLTHTDLEKLEYCAKKARLEGDVIYLFSTAGFDNWLLDAALKPGCKLKLIGIDELTNG